MGTNWPVPADLSDSDPAFEQKEGDGGGLSVGCVSGSVCLRKKGRGKEMTRKEKETEQDGAADGDGT